MPPNNYSITETTTTERQTEELPNHLHTKSEIVQRKSKNHLNSFANLEDVNGNVISENKDTPEYKMELAWFNIFGFIYLHYGLLRSALSVHLNLTLLFAIIIGISTGVGITAGAHRLWSHGAYKANRKLKYLLVMFQTIAFQNSVIEWVRDHRVHHKFTDTNADPHNASRGFFFSHIGWLMCKKHPDVKKFGAKVDMSDLEADPLLRFQHKYYVYIMPIFCFILPGFIPWYFWGDDWYDAYLVAGVARYVIVLHLTWLINSAAHMWGDKPYDENIKPVDVIQVSIIAFGEGFHNYHHVFPWDYKTSELGIYYANITTAFLDFMAWIGWATDLKTVSPEMIKKRVLRTGDGSHPIYKDRLNESSSEEEPKRDLEHFWGWNDELMTEEDKKDALITHITEQE